MNSNLKKNVAAFLAILFLTSTLVAQKPAVSSDKTPQRQTAATTAAPTFDGLLADDVYKVYGEVRSVGTLLSTGGAGDIIDPIVRFAGPSAEFQSLIKFLRSNSEALANSRLLFASWPVRSDIPNVFVAIEFGSEEEAAKFSPKLETFLPTVLTPPATPEPDKKPADQKPAKSTEAATQPSTPSKPSVQTANPAPVPDRPPFVISHSGNLVFITDQKFKFEKLHPPASKPLAEDQNFRIARDRFSAESVFIYINVALEDKSKPKPSPTPFITKEEAEKLRQEDTDASPDEAEAKPGAKPHPNQVKIEERTAVLTASPAATPEATPTPTAEQKAQAVATAQIGQMFDFLGIGEPQWPDAVGVALNLDNNEYVVRSILIEPPDRQKLLLPFLPQLVSGPAAPEEAASVLPEDTEVFVSASIDLVKSYEGMRKEAETRARIAAREANSKEPPLDTFSQFEKKAEFKIKDDLLSALGNEIAVAGSLSTLEGSGFFGPTPGPKPSPPTGDKSDQDKKADESFPVLLIAVKDRDATRRLMPHVLNGLGIGEVNLIAQTEKHDDAEIVNYGNIFGYAFVGNFLAISNTATLRRLVDANNNRQTLSSNNAFRNFTRWESRRMLGQVYISPALMNQYREQLNKQAPKLDPELRDLLMRLSPAPQAISYALTNEGFGALHELHLPKDLIVAMVASTAATMSAIKQGSPETNEMIAIGALSMVANAEGTYQSGKGKGSYGTLDQLVAEKLVIPDIFTKYGYKLDITAAGDRFEAVATPIEYGKTGNRSFFVDKSGTVRGDDHGGAPATSADKPVN